MLFLINLYFLLNIDNNLMSEIISTNNKKSNNEIGKLQ
jgi:hypothetical protein